MTSDRINIVTELTQQGKIREATLLLEELTRLFPAHAVAHVMLADLLAKQGKYGWAWETWQHAYFLLPNSPIIVKSRHELAKSLLTKAEAGQEATHKPLLPYLKEVANENLDELGHIHQTRPTLKTPTKQADGGNAHTNLDLGIDFNWQNDEPEVLPTYPEISWKSLEQTLEALEPDIKKEFLSDTLSNNATFSTDAPENSETEIPNKDSFIATLEDLGDLDDLIAQLENAPRIQPPTNNLRDEEEVLPEDNIEEVVSETLAQIYATQNQYEEAAKVYDQLALQQPEKASYFSEKATSLREKNA